MKKGRFKDLIGKYEQGVSTLAEEQVIVDNAENLTNESQAWFKFIQMNKKKAPKGLQDSIWESIRKEQLLKKRLRIGILCAAASILLVFSITIKPFTNTQSHKKKEALLNQALSMFEDQNTKPVLKTIYEDDLIIIYVSAE